jgi:hypothetical protein
MTLITRRAALGGFAVLPIVGASNAHVPAGNMILPHHPEFSPEDLVQYHLMAAGLAMDGIAHAAGPQWAFGGAGDDAGTERLFAIFIGSSRQKVPSEPVVSWERAAS